MKKNDIFLIVGLVLVIIIGCFVMKGEKYVPGYKLPLALKGEVGLHELSYKEFKEKVDNDEEFVVIIERATCSYCVQFMPIAEDFAKDNKVPMYYVDTDTFSEDEWKEFEKSINFFKEAGDDWGTPTTVVLAGKETVDYISGATDAEALEELYEDNFDLGEE